MKNVLRGFICLLAGIILGISSVHAGDPDARLTALNSPYPIFSLQTGLLQVPRVGIPLGNGQVLIYDLEMEIVDLYSLTFVLTGLAPATGSLTAVFDGSENLLYLPLVALTDGRNAVPVQGVILQATSYMGQIVFYYYDPRQAGGSCSDMGFDDCLWSHGIQPPSVPWQ